jgi:putative OPT family oligopeptide transporter
MNEPEASGGLPENAYRELAPGEVYRPLVPAEASVPEISRRSIVFGLVMTSIFSAAAAYISLKLGQGIESAIPIAILAIGFSAIAARKSTLLENVHIVTLGACAGIVVGGSTFTMPAIFILGLEGRSSFAQVFVVPLLGAILGVLFLIPFRRYFVAEMHGKLPFPEATATAEILVAGERGGRQALVLLTSMGVSLVVDFLALHFKAWRDTFTTVLIPSLKTLTDDVKAIFVLNTSAAVLGLGYIVGLRYATIIMAGSCLSYWVFVPLIGNIGARVPGELFAGRPPVAGLSAEDLFFEYVRYIGIGAIFAAGVLSVLKMSPVIAQAISRVFGEVRKAGRGATSVVRTDLDLPIGGVFAGAVALAFVLFGYFRFSVLADMPSATVVSLVAVILTFGITFLFAAVSAWAIAMISTTPISGMTLTTLIIAAISLSAMGLAGASGMLSVLLIGGVVCTALSMTGSMVTLLKVGYWTGATPKRIEWTLIAGSAVAAVTVTAIMFVFARSYGYVKSPEFPDAVAAPQANAMAAVIASVMQSGNAPWFLYGIGAVVAVIVQMLGISALAFALGMYLPIELNTPILAGAIVAWLVKRPTGNAALTRARGNRGTLIASGFIAGGAIAGVFDGLIRFAFQAIGGSGLPYSLENAGAAGNWIGLAVFVALGAYVWWDARRATEAEGAGPEIAL